MAENENEVKRMTVTFIKNPTGKFSLGYNVGDSGLVEAVLAKKLIKAGYAIKGVDSKEE